MLWNVCVGWNSPFRKHMRQLPPDDDDFLLTRDYELTRRDDHSIGRAVSAFLSDSVLEGA
jgi:hypothetical protein